MVDINAVARCWIRVQCLLCAMEADLIQLHSRTRKTSEQKHVCDLLDMFGRLALQDENLRTEQEAADFQ